MKDFIIKSVLITDDEESCVNVLERFLKKNGFECTSSSNGMEALERIEQYHFDLVISDIRMKGMDGLQLMRDAKEKRPELDFIITTGYSADYTYRDIIEAGAADFIAKPVNLAELMAKMQRIDRERRLIRELRLMNQELQKEIFERKCAEKELMLARNALQELLDEQTQKLSKANDILKRSLQSLKELTEIEDGIGYISP